MKKHNVFILHGIGEQGKGYSKALRKSVRNSMGKCKDSINFVEIVYADILSERVKAYTIEEKAVKGIILDDFREMFNEVAYDAIAYGYKKERVLNKIKAVVDAHCEEGCKNTFIAHSLGGIVLHDFLTSTGFHADNIFTLGTPLALRLLSKNAEVSVDFWLNIVGIADIIGKPLKTAYMNVKQCDKDYIAPIGSFGVRKTPLCHTAYWDDDNVVLPIAYKLIMDVKGNFNRKEYFKKVDDVWEW